MASERVKILTTAIHSILWATQAFQSGFPHVRKVVGAKPSFEIWWDGFDQQGPGRADMTGHITTFRFKLEIYTGLHSEQADQEKLWSLVEVCRDALAANEKLGPSPGVLRSRVINGQMTVVTEQTNPMLVAVLSLEVDYFGIW